MKKTKKILTVIIFFITLILCMKLMDFILVDSGSRFSRYMIEDLYNSKENIDVLFLGTSHTQRSIDTKLIDSLTGKHVFNAGTSSQSMDGSYTLLKEACKTNDIKEVYLELYFGSYYGKFKDREDLTQTYIISNYMKPSINKYTFMFNAGSIDHFVNTFFPARRDWKELVNIQHLKDVLGNKIYPSKGNGTVDYEDKGYVKDKTVCDTDSPWAKKSYGEIGSEAISLYESDTYKYLLNIIDFCMERNIKLVVFAVPIQERMIVSKGNYDKYNKTINKALGDLGIKYYDFNLCSNAYFDANDLSLFSDDHHLNCYGAEKLDTLLSKIINKENIEFIFYDSLKDKLMDEKPTVYGMAGPKNEDGLDKSYIIANRNEGIEYKIELTSTSGEKVFNQDFGTNKYFSYPENDKGHLVINWRLVEKPEEVYTIETDYE